MKIVIYATYQTLFGVYLVKVSVIFCIFLFFALNGCIFATCLTKKDRNHVYEEERREGFVLVSGQVGAIG